MPATTPTTSPVLPPCRYGAQLAPVLLEACGAADPDLRQCSVYGLGVLAAKAPDTFRPLAAETLKRLAAIVQHPEARGERGGGGRRQGRRRRGGAAYCLYAASPHPIPSLRSPPPPR